jgi:murein L,D-transpeptidase YafK
MRSHLTLRCAAALALGAVIVHAAVGSAHARGGERGRHGHRHDIAEVTRAALAGIGTAAGARMRRERLEDKGMTVGSPIMLRIFKEESELELWLLTGSTFELYARYAICFWSGTLGPKLREGDRQAPEGLYSVGVQQLRPTGRRPRSFDIGYPNALDRAAGHTGSDIFIHGGCGSRGCYAMTDAAMEQIYVLGEQALAHGQDHFQVEVFPFRMTEANMARHADSPWLPFWANLKVVYEQFDRTHVPPQVQICGGRYLLMEPAMVAGDDGVTAGPRPCATQAEAAPGERALTPGLASPPTPRAQRRRAGLNRGRAQRTRHRLPARAGRHRTEHASRGYARRLTTAARLHPSLPA